MNTYDAIYEQAGDGGWGATVAGLPVFSAGDTLEEAEEGICESLALYLDHCRRTGVEPVPEDNAAIGTVTV